MQKRRLARSNNRWVGGVLSGLAHYFDHDPTGWRFGFICFLLLTGLMPGLLMYAIGYFIMPAPVNGPDFSYRVVED